MKCMCHEDVDQGFFEALMPMIPCRDTCAYIVQDSFALNGNFRIRGCEENIWTYEENYRTGSAITYILY